MIVAIAKKKPVKAILGILESGFDMRYSSILQEMFIKTNIMFYM